MLQIFRDNIRKLAPILWIVIAVFVLLMFSPNGPSGNGSPQDTAATVDGEKITYGEFQNAYQNLEQRVRDQLGGNVDQETLGQLHLANRAMDQLISRRAQLREADRMGLEPTEAELRDAILQYPVFRDDKGRFVGVEQYEKILRANRLVPENFEQDIRRQVLLDKFHRVLADSVWVSEDEIERQARDEAESANVRWVELAGDVVAADVTLGDDELQSYFDEHRADYLLPEQRRVAYLSVNVNTVRASLEIPAEDLHAYYDAHHDEFTRQEQVRAQHILLFVTPQRTAEQAKAQLEKIKQRVEGGEDFQQLAREFSEDEATKSRGGDLGFFGRGQMTPQFEEAAFGAEAGTVVGPIENQLGPRTGYHLIKVLSHQEGGLQPYEEVENLIRVRLLNQRAQSAAEEQANALYDRVKGREDLSEESLRKVATDEGVGFEVVGPFGVDDTLPGIGRSTPFHQLAFSLEPGTLSEPTRIQTGWALLDVLDVEPSHEPELTEVESKVRADALSKKRGERAAQLAAAMVEKLRGGAKFEAELSPLGLTPVDANDLKKRGNISGLSQKVSRELIDQALDSEEGAVGGPIATEKGAVVFRVVARQHFDPSTLDEQRETLRDRLASQRFNNLLGSLIAQRMADMKVSYSRAFVESFDIDTGAATDS